MAKKGIKKTKKEDTRVANTPAHSEEQSEEKVLYFEDGMTVGDIADALGVGAASLIKKLMGLGIMAAQTQSIDRETTELLVLDYGFEVKDKVITDLTKFDQIDIVDDEKDLV
jgi:translation initiation factor IF-2